MRKILFAIFFIFSALSSIGQVLPGYTLVNGKWEYVYFAVQKGMGIPNDTLSDAPVYGLAVKGSTLYTKLSTGVWVSVGGAGSGGVWGFVAGDINAQADLQALAAKKYDTTKRFVDTLYITSDTTIVTLNKGLLHTYKIRGAIPSFNNRKGNIILTQSDVDTALGYAPSNLPNVTNLLQVINAGGAISLQTGAYGDRPIAGTYGRFYLSVDSARLEFDNGTSWQSTGSGGGGGGGAGTVTAVIKGYGLLPGTITTSGTIVVDSATLAMYFMRRGDSGINYITPLQLSLKEPLITAANSVNKYWNGYKQFVGLNTDSVFEGTTNKFFTNARARVAVSITTTGSGAATYDNTTGIFNIPTNSGGTDSAIAGRNGVKVSVTGTTRYIESDTAYMVRMAHLYASLDSLNGIIVHYKDSAGTTGFAKFDRLYKVRDSLFAAINVLKITNAGNVSFFGHGTYAGRPTSGLGLYYADDSSGFFGINGSTATRLTDAAGKTANIYFRGKGQPGDTSYVYGRDSTIWVRAKRDSGGYHHAVLPDSSEVDWSLDSNGINALQSKYDADTARIRQDAATAGKVTNAGASKSISAGPLSSRPAASNCQCYYFSTTDSSWSYDNGAWLPVKGGGSGASPTLPLKAIGFGSSSNLLTGDTSKIKHDSATNGHTFMNVNTGPTTRYIDYFYGNSETIGYQLPVATDAYPQQVAWRMGDSAVNNAISGRTLQNTGWAAATGFILGDTSTLPTYCATCKFLFNGIGVNDVRYVNASFDSATFRTAYRLWVIAAIRKGWPAQRIVLISPFYVPNLTYKNDSIAYSFTSAATQARSIGFGISVQAVATEFGTKFADGYNAVFKNGADQIIQSDSLHMAQYADRAVTSAVLSVVDTVRMVNQRLAVDGQTTFNDLRLKALPVIPSRDNSYPLGTDSVGKVGQIINGNYRKLMVGGAKYADDIVADLQSKGPATVGGLRVNAYKVIPTSGTGLEFSKYPASNDYYITALSNGSGTPSGLALNAYGGNITLGGIGFASDGSKFMSPGFGTTAGMFLTGLAAPTSGTGMYLGYSSNVCYIYGHVVGGATVPIDIGFGGSKVMINQTDDGVHGFQVGVTAKFNNPIGIQIASNASALMTFAGSTSSIAQAIFTPSASFNASKIAGQFANVNGVFTYDSSSLVRKTLATVESTVLNFGGLGTANSWLGLQNYDHNYGSTFTARSFVDKNYADSAGAKRVLNDSATWTGNGDPQTRAGVQKKIDSLAALTGSKIVSSTDVVAQTTAVGLASYTTTSAGVYRVGGYLNITAISANTINVFISWTDENSASRTYTFLPNTGTTGFYPFQDVQIKAATGTTIQIQTNVTGAGSQTFDGGGTIEKLR